MSPGTQAKHQDPRHNRGVSVAATSLPSSKASNRLGRVALALALVPLLFGLWMGLDTALDGRGDSLGGLTYYVATLFCVLAFASAGLAGWGLAVGPRTPRAALALTAAGFALAALLAGSLLGSALVN